MMIMVMVEAMVMIRCSSLEKKKEKNKKAQGSRHQVGVSVFRIDSRTIKRGKTHREMQLSKCH